MRANSLQLCLTNNSRYSEVRDMEVELLQKHFHEDGVFKAYGRKLHAVCKGELPHAEDMMLSFAKGLSKRP